MEFFSFQYYGVDWAAMLLTIVSIYYIGNKEKFGFILMMICNLLWAVLGWQTGSAAMILANLIFLGMNWQALYKWSQED